MRTQLDALVRDVCARGAAVPAFTCYDFTTALAVVEAAESAGEGVILLVAPKTISAPSGLRLIRALRDLADSAAVPVSVQLDHASDIPSIVAGINAGADSVLADGSSLGFEENLRLVQAVRDAIDDPTIVMEAELGGLAGDEDRAFAVEVSADVTNPSAVSEFVERSGASLLAVAIGNAHGRYSRQPQLQWDVLFDISGRTDVPLVLHGASGIPAADLSRAAGTRIGKVNFNTELRTGVLEALERDLPARRNDGENLLGLLATWRQSAHGFATSTLEILSAR